MLTLAAVFINVIAVTCTLSYFKKISRNVGISLLPVELAQEPRPEHELGHGSPPLYQ